MAMKVWVYAEADGDKPHSSTLELVTKARELGDVEAVHIGADPAALAGPLGEHGVTTLYAADPGEALPGVVGAAVLTQLVEAHHPDLILFAQTYDGRDAIARLSAALDRPLLTNGTALSVDGDRVTVGNAAFGGNVLVDTAFTGPSPYLAAIRPKSFAAEPSGGAPRPSRPSPRPRPAGPGTRASSNGTSRSAKARSSRTPPSSCPAAAGWAAPRRTSRSSTRSPPSSMARRERHAPSSTPAGCPTPSRSARPARS